MSRDVQSLAEYVKAESDGGWRALWDRATSAPQQSPVQDVTQEMQPILRAQPVTAPPSTSGGGVVFTQVPIGGASSPIGDQPIPVPSPAREMAPRGGAMAALAADPGAGAGQDAPGASMASYGPWAFAAIAAAAVSLWLIFGDRDRKRRGR